MVWDQFQVDRLNYEARVLKENHPRCEFEWKDDRGIVRIWHHVDGSLYRLRLEIPGTYPDEKPKVYVEYPVPLKSYWPDRTIAQIGANHNYHILSTSSAGEVQICHFPDNVWDASKSIHLVVLKAKLWLEAYATHHLKTSQPICDFFNDCK